MKINPENYPDEMTEKESSRFWSKVDKNGPWCYVADLMDQCWVWKSGRQFGYGIFWIRGQNSKAHRISYVATKGPIPEDLFLDHLCRNKICVNPNHLEPVTTKENTQRGSAWFYQSSKTECPRGHSLKAFNLVKNQFKKGVRSCLSCHRASAYIKNNGGDLKEVSDEYYTKLVKAKL